MNGTPWLRRVVTLGLFALAGVATAADTPQFPGPEPEHAFLKRFVGEWVTTSECQAGPDQPAMASSGTIKARMLGEHWVISNLENSGGGFQMQGVQTIGYDPAKKKYVGTWVDSVMNHLWLYEGTVSGETLTLEAKGPNMFEQGQLTRFRDVYEFVSADEIRVSAQIETSDGKWTTFMNGTSRRKQ